MPLVILFVVAQQHSHVVINTTSGSLVHMCKIVAAGVDAGDAAQPAPAMALASTSSWTKAAAAHVVIGHMFAAWLSKVS